MIIKCLNRSLIDNINTVIKAVSGKATSMKILECILFTADEGSLRLLASDLEMSIESESIDCDVTESGCVAIDAKMINEITRKFPSDAIVSINSDDKNITSIECDNSQFKILGMDGEEFPTMPFVEKSRNCKINSNELKDLIKKTIFSVSQQDIKPVLTGELFEINKEQIRLVAVDGFRVSFVSYDIKSSKSKMSVVIPARTLGEVSKILSSEDEKTVTIYTTEKHALFEIEGCTVVTRLLEGEFIKYEQIFTEDYKTLITIKRNDFIIGLERASLIASKDLKKSPIRLKIDNKKMVISSNTQMGTVRAELLIDIEGESIEIAFNPKFLTEALKVIDEETVTVQFTTPLSPCIIKPIGNDRCKYLVLPLRLE